MLPARIVGKRRERINNHKRIRVGEREGLTVRWPILYSPARTTIRGGLMEKPKVIPYISGKEFEDIVKKGEKKVEVIGPGGRVQEIKKKTEPPERTRDFKIRERMVIHIGESDYKVVRVRPNGKITLKEMKRKTLENGEK
jgi:hypothetical protein